MYIDSSFFGKTKAFQALRRQSCGVLEAEHSSNRHHCGLPLQRGGTWLGERGHLDPAGNLCPLLKRKAEWDLVSCNSESARNTNQILRWFYTAETELALKEFVCFTRSSVVVKSIGFPTLGASQVGFGGVLISVLPWL